MNLRLGGTLRARKKIEIAALVGLAAMLGIHRTIAAQKMRRRRLPGGAAPRELFFADVKMDFARRDVDLDFGAGLHQSQWPADKAFGRDVQDAGAVAGAAHARI